METYVLIALAALLVGGGISFAFARPRSKAIEQKAQAEADRIRKTAEKESERILAAAQQQSDKVRDNARQEESQLRSRLEKMQAQADERMARREEALEQKLEKAETAREKYEDVRREMEEKKKELESRLDEQNTELEKVAKMSQDDAKELLVERVEAAASAELAETLRRKVDLMRESADDQAKEILAQSIQRFASEVTQESTVTLVKIESDSLKGKIIGREGRNINAFEMMTGVDVIIDDTPGAITLSSYDMFRRFIAKIAMEELLKDGRIHPSKIEECVRKAQKNAEKLLLDLGKRAAQELGVTGFPDQILKLVGRLRFRTSYGQNVLTHSMEVAWLAEGLALEVPGADPEICKKAGLVHDIGKAVSHEVEGGHAVIGKEILEKFGIPEPIVTAMKSHHEDFPYESIEARVLQAADAISASRPGARRETLEKYLKRLKELESIASSFEGVEKVFAIQAGREVRVFVNSKDLDDYASEKLSFDIARKIEKNCEYPGEVRVAIYRESKFEQVAK